jgi:hypothetical protein
MKPFQVSFDFIIQHTFLCIMLLQNSLSDNPDSWLKQNKFNQLSTLVWQIRKFLSHFKYSKLVTLKKIKLKKNWEWFKINQIQTKMKPSFFLQHICALINCDWRKKIHLYDYTVECNMEKYPFLCFSFFFIYASIFV